MVLDLLLEQGTKTIDVDFETEDAFGADFSEVIEVPASDIPVYDGAYDVKPLVTEQELATSGKLMQDNVRILSIPFFSVSNTSGGNTVYIGNEKEITIT